MQLPPLRYGWILLLLLGYSMSNAQQLDQHQWKDRVIIIFAPDSNDLLLQDQLKLFSGKDSEIVDRDLVIYQITPDNGSSSHKSVLDKVAIQELYNQFKIKNDEFALLLIGKDGGKKFHSNELTAPKVLFNLIDSMPMRQSEMRRKKKG